MSIYTHFNYTESYTHKHLKSYWQANPRQSQFKLFQYQCGTFWLSIFADAETDHSDPAPDTEPYEAAPDLEDTNTTNYVVEDKQSTIRSRSSYFLTSHTLSSLFILYPSIAIMTVLVTRAQNIQDMDISTAAIFPINYLSYIFLPLLGLCLAVSILIVRPFHRADRGKGEILKGTIIV